MDVFGVWNEEIDSLPDDMKNGIVFNGSRYDAMELCARIHPLTAEVLGTYEKDFYAGEAALTKNKFGKGGRITLRPVPAAICFLYCTAR